MKNKMNLKNCLRAGACAVALLFSCGAFAQDIGVVVGVRADSADAKTTGVTTSGKSGFQVGGIAKFDVSGPLQLRTGFVYSQKSYELKASGSTVDTKFTYFEIPLNLLYKFSDYGGAFVGPNVALNVSKDCGSLTCTGVSSSPVGLQLGGSFKFAPQLGFEFYYETMLSKVADEIENPRAVVANLMITFD